MSFDTVDKLNREFERGYNNGQVKEAVTTYANDARLFATDKQVYEGLAQIEKYYAAARNAGNSKVELHTGQIIPCGSDHLVEIRFAAHLFSSHLFRSLQHLSNQQRRRKLRRRLEERRGAMEENHRHFQLGAIAANDH